MSSIKNNILQFPKVKPRRVEVPFTQAQINKLLAKRDLKVGTSIYDNKRKGLLIYVGKLGLKYSYITYTSTPYSSIRPILQP